jgi:hypothetical protein
MSSLISELRPDELVSELVARFPTLEISFDDQNRSGGRAKPKCDADARIAFGVHSSDIQARLESLRGSSAKTLFVVGPGEFIPDADAVALAKQETAGTNIVVLECKSVDVKDVTISGVSAVQPDSLERDHLKRLEDTIFERARALSVSDQSASKQAMVELSKVRRIASSSKERYRDELAWMHDVRADLPHILVDHAVRASHALTESDIKTRLRQIGEKIRDALHHTSAADWGAPAEPFSFSWMCIHPDRIDLPPVMSSRAELNYLSWQYREACARNPGKDVRLCVDHAFFSVNEADPSTPTIGKPLAAYIKVAALCHRRLEVMGLPHQIETFPCDFLNGRPNICVGVYVESLNIEVEKQVRDILLGDIGKEIYEQFVSIDVVAFTSLSAVPKELRTLSRDGLEMVDQISRMNYEALVKNVNVRTRQEFLAVA